MSTSSSQAKSASWELDSDQDWKQEVNRRLAEHKSRRGLSAIAQAAPAEAVHGSGSRAAQAAARVAARYAKAPSYSEMQAAETRTAVLTAEIATEVARQAQATAQAMLASLEAASNAEERVENKPIPVARPEPVLKAAQEPIPHPVLPPVDETPAYARSLKSTKAIEKQTLGVRWEPDMPMRQIEPPVAHAPQPAGRFEIPLEHWWEPEPQVDESLAGTALEPVEPAQPIFANLIEFPRELVATRKVRPRLAEGPFAEPGATGAQLSIFEVDPGTVSIEPEIVDAVAQPVAPIWSGMELDDQPLPEIKLEEQTVRKTSNIEMASMSRRLLSAVVDGTLILGTFMAGVAVAASQLQQLPALKEMEIGAATALVAFAALYMIVFSTLTAATPGMKYAGLSLCTFDDQFPSRAQRCGRLGALLLSLLPMGLGIIWGLFDEEQLSWHDRLSKTYQRKC